MRLLVNLGKSTSRGGHLGHWWRSSIAGLPTIILAHSVKQNTRERTANLLPRHIGQQLGDRGRADILAPTKGRSLTARPYTEAIQAADAEMFMEGKGAWSWSGYGIRSTGNSCIWASSLMGLRCISG